MQFLICLCGGQPHTVDCPRPEYRNTEAAVEAWLLEANRLRRQRSIARMDALDEALLSEVRSLFTLSSSSIEEALKGACT